MSVHRFEPFRPDDSRCDQCGEPEDDLERHPPGLRLYRIDWRAVVTGHAEEWGRTAAEARRAVDELSESALEFEVSQYDGIVETPAGAVLRVTRVKRVGP